MSLRQKEVCELTAKMAAGALLIADLLYMVLLGMNIAVLPAAYVEIEAWGTKVALAFSAAIVVVLLVLEVLLVAALVKRSRMPWFIVADALSLLLLLGGTAAFSATVHDSVVGTDALPICNTVLAPVLILALGAAVALEWERGDSPLARLKRRSGNVAMAPMGQSELESAAHSVTGRDARTAGQRERLRRRRVQHARRVRRVRH